VPLLPEPLLLEPLLLPNAPPLCPLPPPVFEPPTRLAPPSRVLLSLWGVAVLPVFDRRPLEMPPGFFFITNLRKKDRFPTNQGRLARIPGWWRPHERSPLPLEPQWRSGAGIFFKILVANCQCCNRNMMAYKSNPSRPTCCSYCCSTRFATRCSTRIQMGKARGRPSNMQALQ
jgi:hypothetical protein